METISLKCPFIAPDDTNDNSGLQLLVDAENNCSASGIPGALCCYRSMQQVLIAGGGATVAQITTHFVDLPGDDRTIGVRLAIEDAQLMRRSLTK